MHTIQLSDNDIAVIFDALGELKLKIAGPVFTNIQQQLMQPTIEDAAYHQAVADADGWAEQQAFEANIERCQPIENADTNAA